MDYGTIISGVCEARYSNVGAVLNDSKLVAENCEKFYVSTHKSATVEVARLVVDSFSSSLTVVGPTYHERLDVASALSAGN